MAAHLVAPPVAPPAAPQAVPPAAPPAAPQAVPQAVPPAAPLVAPLVAPPVVAHLPVAHPQVLLSPILLFHMLIPIVGVQVMEVMDVKYISLTYDSYHMSHTV